MAKVADKLDIIEQNIMSGLKDFQRATVNRIDELYRSGQMRVLVSDEVGLGKTLIARGTVAKLAQIQKEAHDKLVKVVYICSNIAIAEQNLNKLRITNELKTENAGYSRLSMQHLNIFMQENDTELLDRYIQLIPLFFSTPSPIIFTSLHSPGFLTVYYSMLTSFTSPSATAALSSYLLVILPFSTHLLTHFTRFHTV